MANVNVQHAAAAEALMTPEERQQLKAAGVNSAIVAALIRAFLSALLANLPGILGTGTAPNPIAPTAPRS